MRDKRQEGCFASFGLLIPSVFFFVVIIVVVRFKFFFSFVLSLDAEQNGEVSCAGVVDQEFNPPLPHSFLPPRDREEELMFY